MADKASVVHVGQNSPAEVAFKLYKIVGYAEKKTDRRGGAEKNTDRKYILDLYGECLFAVNGHRVVSQI